MKAEHRKELETNILADKMGHAIQALKEGPSRRTVAITSAIAGVLLLYLVWSMVKRSSENTSSDLWERWHSVATPADLESFAKDNPGTLQGRLARFQTARLDLAQGMADLGNPLQRNQALEKVRRAAAVYESLIDESAREPLLQQEAILNAGKAYETLEDAEQAKRFYQRLAKSFPKTVAGQDAENCLKRLEAGTKDLEALKKIVTAAGGPNP